MVPHHNAPSNFFSLCSMVKVINPSLNFVENSSLYYTRSGDK